MILNKLKKVLAATTVFTLLVGLIPESAQAQRARYSGSTANTTEFSFDLNTNVPDSNVDSNIGYFSGAIKNYKRTSPDGDLTNDVCGNPICPPGNVTVTKLMTDSNGNVPGISEGKDYSIDDLQSIVDFLGEKTIDLSKNVIRYDFNLNNDPKAETILFIQSNDSNLINNLSGLIVSNNIIGFYTADPEGSQFRLDRTKQVPEPTASFLVLGAMGVGSLLQYKKRRNKDFLNK